MDNTGLLPLVVEDFSGGKTDFYLGGPINKAQVYDNYILDENNDIITRPGSALKYEERLSVSGTIKNIIDNQNEILMQANRSVIYVDEDGVHEVKSPFYTSNDVFYGGDDSINADFTYWNKHTLGASDLLNHPQKIYKDENGDWTVTNLGLPEIMFTTCINLFNLLKAAYNSHIADLGAHIIADTTNTCDSATPVMLSELALATEDLLESFQGHLDDGQEVTPVYHDTTFVTILRESTILTIDDVYRVLLHIWDEYANHHNNDTIHDVVDSFSVGYNNLKPRVDAGAGDNSYIFGLQYAYRYQLEDLEFLERGPIHLVELADSTPPSGGFTIPFIASVSGENFDTPNITKVIYRTVNNGNTLYKLTEIANSVDTYYDTLSDDDLQLNPTAYTEGGILDDVRPPPCKFIKTINDITYFGGVNENTIFKGNRLKSSKPGAPYSSPGQFYLDFESDITGIGTVGTYPIVFLNKAFYRVDGFYTSNGTGGMDKRSISQRIGCISEKSIVTTKSGAYFASEDGFYFTDGTNCRKISQDINFTYENLFNKQNIVGSYDALRNRVLWAVQVDEVSTANDQVFVAFCDYKTEYDGHPIFTWSGGRDAENFSASCLNYIDGELLRADRRGYLLYHDQALLSDIHINTSYEPEDFFTQTIFYDYTSVAFDFGNAQTRKWVSKVNINADNETSLSLNIETSNDNSGIFVELKPVIKKLTAEWGDPTVIWDESELRWNYGPVISEWRWMNAGEQNLRCMYKQIKFTNAYVDIDDSQGPGPASGNTMAKTITLLDDSDSWIDDIVNYYISFDVDDYEREYKIINQVGNVLTIEDETDMMPELPSNEWRLKGYRKREVFNLLNYVLNYRQISMTQDTYRSTSE